MQTLTGLLAGPVRELRGSMNATGKFQTRGLVREELAENLTGQMDLRVRDISFGNFDPLGTLVQSAHWGKLDPMRGPVTTLPATLNVEIRDRRFILKTLAVDLNGARLQLDGTYTWAGTMNLDVRADLRRVRRRWLVRDDAPQPSAALPEVRLGGPLDHLIVNPQEAIARVGRNRGADGVR